RRCWHTRKRTGKQGSPVGRAMPVDTQWPRFTAFLQAASGKPFQYVGSVHAPDSEMALLNARDVFVRRPACHALWVVPAARIFSRTLEELAANPRWADDILDSGGPELSYHIFTKRNQAGLVAQVGEIAAASPEFALKKATE